MCPAGNNLVVGLKPTLGLLAQDGIIPIAHNQDTAGPICRTATDVAILLSAMQTPFGPVAGRRLPRDAQRDGIAEVFEHIIAKNRAGGWRRLKREA